MFEGLPNYPDASRYWQVVEKYKVTQFYTGCFFEGRKGGKKEKKKERKIKKERKERKESPTSTLHLCRCHLLA
jgi:hypothetical protein